MSFLWISGGLSNNNLSDFRNSKARASKVYSGHTAGDDAPLTGLARELAHGGGGNVGTSALRGFDALRLSPCQSAFEDSMSTLCGDTQNESKPLRNFAASAKKIQTKPVGL